MTLTWATGVRFERTTRRNERENELHLAANGRSSPGPKKRLFLLVICIFMFFELFWAFCFRPCVTVLGLLSFLGPFRIFVLIYMLL
ncbi:hypothetical protein Hanom_Chr04g00301881 [Helianthus anomalus]